MGRAPDGEDTIVIGGGLGGLCAATLLARAGKRVRLLEEAAQLGGRARSRTQRGYVLNMGAHALYKGGPAMRLLAALDVKPAGRAVDGSGDYVLQQNRLHPLPVSGLALLRSDLLGVRGKWEMLRLLATLGERKAARVRGRSVGEWLRRDCNDPGARRLVEMLVRLTCYAHASDLLEAKAAVRQLARAVTHGVMYVDGGWQWLVDAVAERARQADVHVELGAGVERIEHTAGEVCAAVLRDGRKLQAKAVVAAVDPKALWRMLPDDACARRWAEAAIPLRAACLDVGVPSLPHPERINVLSTEAPLYFANHSAYAQLAPPGHSVLQLVRYLGPGEEGRGAERELRDFLERIQPGAYARAEVKRFTPNLVVHTDLPGAERARGEHPELAGLHLVSDASSGRAMLADAVLDSAWAAAARLAPELERATASERAAQAKDGDGAADPRYAA